MCKRITNVSTMLIVFHKREREREGGIGAWGQTTGRYTLCCCFVCYCWPFGKSLMPPKPSQSQPRVVSLCIYIMHLRSTFSFVLYIFFTSKLDVLGRKNWLQNSFSTYLRNEKHKKQTNCNAKECYLNFTV